MAALTEEQARHLFYSRLTRALHMAAAEAVDKSGDSHLIHVLGQMKRFERAIEDAAGNPQDRVKNYPK